MDMMLRIKAIFEPLLAELRTELARAYPNHPADAFTLGVGYAVGATLSRAADDDERVLICKTINHLLQGYRLEPIDC